MKKNILSCHFICLLILAFTSISIAQSDYETVQKFKKDCEKIEHQIKNANSADKINLITGNIKELKSKYSRHSELLDKALYPEKYHAMIENLDNLFTLREEDFNTVEVLKVEVSDLKQRVDTLSIMNNELQISLNEIQLLFDKSSKESAELNGIVADLKTALYRRDMLVINMVHDLMPPVMREKPLLSSEDKEQIVSDIENKNILINVKTTIKDNVRYLDLTSLQPEDISELQEQQIEFAEIWARIGPRLVDVYSSDNNRVKELREIDSLFAVWTASVKKEVWQSIKEEFTEKGITLVDFSDGVEFTNSINQFIKNEKKNIDDIPEEEAKYSFELFVDSTWSSEIKPKWASFLIENELFTENNQATIEENIDVWRSELYPSRLWIWFIIPGFLLAGLALLLRMLKNGAQYYDIPGK